METVEEFLARGGKITEVAYKEPKKIKQTVIAHETKYAALPTKHKNQTKTLWQTKPTTRRRKRNYK